MQAEQRGNSTRRQPQRSCVACRRAQDKRGLIRLVRGDEHVAIDESGRARGRGAYLCLDAACWRRGLASGALARALKTTLAPEDRAALEAYAEQLEATTASRGGKQ